MNKKLLWTIAKYGLGLGLLAWVVWSNWESSGILPATKPAHLISHGLSAQSLAPGGGPMAASAQLLVASNVAESDAFASSPGLKDALQRDLNFGPLFIAIAICAVSLLLTFVRWHLLVRAQGLPFTLRDALRLGLVGFSFSTFLPGSVGGDIIKAAFLAREQNRRTVAVATVLFDRILGLSGLIWLAALMGAAFWLFGFITQPDLIFILIGAWVICLISLFTWLSLGLIPNGRASDLATRLEGVPKIGVALAELWRAIWMFRCRRRSVLKALCLAVLGHVGFVMVFYFCALTLFRADAVPPLTSHYLAVPVGLLVQAGFPAPGGIGGGELAFGKLYELIGFAAASGVLASLVQRAIMWMLGLIGYLAYLRMRPNLAQKPRSVPINATVRQELAVAKV